MDELSALGMAKMMRHLATAHDELGLAAAAAMRMSGGRAEVIFNEINARKWELVKLIQQIASLESVR